MIKQIVQVRATDPLEFMKVVQSVIIRGARYDETTFVYLNTLPMMADFLVEIDEFKNQWKDNGPHIYALPLSEKAFGYSREALEKFEWEEFKKICKEVGITGRDRSVMTNQYLNYLKEE